ncbi:MAG: phosphomethylpyrimidine synthase ThiC, partial [bacterium]
MALSERTRPPAPALSREPFPGSRKVHVPGLLHPDLRVPMREISQSPTRTRAGLAPNPPLTVYDTSGPFTDPDVAIDPRRGLPRPLAPFIEARGDSELLPGPSSAWA